MSFQSYIDLQLKKLGGAGLYLVIVALFVLAGRSLQQMLRGDGSRRHGAHRR